MTAPAPRAPAVPVGRQAEPGAASGPALPARRDGLSPRRQQLALAEDLTRLLTCSRPTSAELLEIVHDRLTGPLGLVRSVLYALDPAGRPVRAAAQPQPAAADPADDACAVRACCAADDPAAGRRREGDPDPRAGAVLVAAGRPVGVLVLVAPAGACAALTGPGRAGVRLHLAWTLAREALEREDALTRRSAQAVRQLLEEGSRSTSVRDAGQVLARATAAAFSTERAGMYVVDPDGVICETVGVGLSAELAAALEASLLGKQARQSPVWVSTERALGPVLVTDADATARRPGGFVQTLGFQSYVAIPLLSKDGPLGLVICGDSTARREWTDAEADLARSLALEGALVVESARLREADRARLRELSHLAFHDGLTGLPNRDLLLERVRQAVGRPGTGVALLLLDLNDFKQVNDTLGHHYGDVLLTAVGARLAALTSDAAARVELVARLGGDEFAVLVVGDDPAAAGQETARRVEAALAAPFALGDLSLHVAPSIGIALHPEHAPDAPQLMQRADVAMYASKRGGTGPVLYDPGLDVLTVDKLAVYSELHGALRDEELVLCYQPKLDLRSGTISGAEALVRWQHPRRGLLAPGEFLPVAEATDLIHPLTRWVLRSAVRQWQRWRDQGLLLDVAVNVSAVNLRDPAFIGDLRAVVAGTGVAPHLVLEITETAVAEDAEVVAALLRPLRAEGLRVSMDDFGAGWSSLAQLRTLPVDELKMDRLLVRGVGSDPVDDAIVRTVVELGHSLGLRVVAEGVEDAPALEALTRMGCDTAQGYLVSRPVPPDELLALLLEQGVRRTG